MSVILATYVEFMRFSFQSAVGYDHQEKLAQHNSQKDYSTGFGGKYGVQKDRVDKVRLLL